MIPNVNKKTRVRKKISKFTNHGEMTCKIDEGLWLWAPKSSLGHFQVVPSWVCIETSHRNLTRDSHRQVETPNGWNQGPKLHRCLYNDIHRWLQIHRGIMINYNCRLKIHRVFWMCALCVFFQRCCLLHVRYRTVKQISMDFGSHSKSWRVSWSLSQQASSSSYEVPSAIHRNSLEGFSLVSLYQSKYM